ncbi:hypothetical protein GL279_12350 [Paracoccus limosus]|uniref:Zinc finger/thioredoxin putative domain-containing protein n=1 Tax=Paracoccus limosus TaxID=913252 RepID=A0A844H3J0_9RHOB|nr:zinc-ribbon domain-containing protein [Paracoccus limosus]MTH35392.1 hypothetical protein [Paracoccus limosus]
MRLTCPRCAVQYEIPEAVIPTGGREVECSACGHVWHQDSPQSAAQGKEIAPKTLDRAEVAPDPAASGPAAGARPVLHRNLDDDVLAILREEAQRELSARAREARDRAPHDHNSVTSVQQEAAPAPKPAANPQPASFDWPVSTVILPGEPIRDPAGTSPDAEPEAAVPEAVMPAPADSRRNKAAAPKPTPEAAAAPAIAPESAPAADAQPESRTPRAADTPPPLPPIEEPVASITDPEPEDQPAAAPAPEPVPPQPPRPRLPDAARLAATLTRPLPQAAPSQPALAETAVITPAPERRAQVPALRAPRTGRGYAAGFALAVLLALALVGSYALAPRAAPGTEAGPAAQWRLGIDRARLWLHDQAARIAGN